MVIASGMRRLRSAERSALVLTFFEDRSQREVGARMGCSQMQVSRLVASGLQHLREHAVDRLSEAA